MNPIVDTIIIILFVIMLGIFVVGFNRQTIENYHKKIEQRDKRHEEALKRKEKEENN